MKNIIKTLNTKKACPDDDIPVKLIKMNQDIISRLFQNLLSMVNSVTVQIFSKFQCSFRKGFNTHSCLLDMIENWKESLDQGGHYGALLTSFVESI